MKPVQLNHRFVERAPTYKELSEIRKLESVTYKGKSLGGVYAFTQPHFRFVHDPAKDWKPVSQAPKTWQFIGQSVTLEVSPEVVLPSEYRRWRDILAPIIQHERLHVKDAKKIVSSSLPSALKREATFKKYFIDRAPMADAVYASMIKPGKRASEMVEDEFATLWNKSVAERDTPAKYKPVQEAVDAAFRKRHP